MNLLTRPPMRSSSQNGFALIEVLVGLTILSIALLAGVRAIASSADTQMAISQRTLALYSADNILMDLRIARTFPAEGATILSCPQANTILVCQRKIMSTPNPALHRVEVTVYAANPDDAQQAVGPRLAWLTTVIANPAGTL